MAIDRYPVLETLFPLVDLQIHHVALKTFHYHESTDFPYNLLISVVSGKKGAGDYFLNCESGEKTSLRVGHAYLLPCHLPVTFERTPGFTVVTMRFNLSFFYGLDIFDGVRHIEDIPAGAFTSMLKRTLREKNPDHIRNALAIKTEVSRLCLSRWPRHLRELSPRMWRYEEVFTYVKARGDATLTIARLARLCGMRQDVFSRSFARDVGIPPKQYVNDDLVRKISSLLLTSQLSIKEIARELRFSSQYYLSRFFKKQTRMCPREYRKRFLVAASAT